MKAVYEVFLRKEEKGFSIFVPGWDIYTQGENLVDSMEMARDAIGLMGIDYEDDNKVFPDTTENLLPEEYDFKTFVDVDFDLYRRKIKNLSVKKNCTIPAWLAEQAEKRGINFSKVLQDGLIELIK